MSNSILENRLRRKAKRQGLTLRGTRTRDPDALAYGKFWVVDLETGQATTALLSLAQIEHLLYRSERRA